MPLASSCGTWLCAASLFAGGPTFAVDTDASAVTATELAPVPIDKSVHQVGATSRHYCPSCGKYHTEATPEIAPREEGTDTSSLGWRLLHPFSRPTPPPSYAAPTAAPRSPRSSLLTKFKSFLPGRKRGEAEAMENLASAQEGVVAPPRLLTPPLAPVAPSRDADSRGQANSPVAGGPGCQSCKQKSTVTFHEAVPETAVVDTEVLKLVPLDEQPVPAPTVPRMAETKHEVRFHPNAETPVLLPIAQPEEVEINHLPRGQVLMPPVTVIPLN